MNPATTILYLQEGIDVIDKFNLQFSAAVLTTDPDLQEHLVKEIDFGCV